MEVKVRPTGDDQGIVYYANDDRMYWHREDGPAVIYKSGNIEWWYYNTFYYYPETMPLNLFLAYCKWEYKKDGN